MDIQKELNEWADWFIPHDSKDLRDALELNSFNQLNVEKLLAINGLSEAYVFRAKDSWKAWQAAKAQAVPDGFVVVPVQCPDPDFADSLFDELSKKAIGEFGDDLLIHFSDIDEEKIWALMVEAAKAQAVPEGYVLVDAESLVLHARSIRIFNTGEQYSEDIEDHVCSIEAMIEAQEPASD